MPEEGVKQLGHTDVLRYEEIAAVVRASVETGISRLRITGGEPLVRPGVTDLVKMLKDIDGIKNISLTTNAILLSDFARPLADAGLNRVNISLDTLKPEKYREITRVGRIEKVFDGIKAARDAGLEPIKINTVVIKGFNDDEIMDLSEWALENRLHLRFIEFMPVSDSSFSHKQKYLSSDDIRERVFESYPDLKQCGVYGNGPAVTWRRDVDEGSLGIIEAVSHSFCGNCNRIRLTSDGKLRPCLFSDDEVDLLPAIRGGESEEVISSRVRRLFEKAVMMKPESHGNFNRVGSESRCMNEIGG